MCLLFLLVNEKALQEIGFLSRLRVLADRTIMVRDKKLRDHWRPDLVLNTLNRYPEGGMTATSGLSKIPFAA